MCIFLSSWSWNLFSLFVFPYRLYWHLPSRSALRKITVKWFFITISLLQFNIGVVWTSIIAGRAIKAEWLSIGTLLTAASVAAISMSGGSKKETAPTDGAGAISMEKERGKFGSRCVIHLYVCSRISVRGEAHGLMDEPFSLWGCSFWICQICHRDVADLVFTYSEEEELWVSMNLKNANPF